MRSSILVFLASGASSFAASNEPKSPDLISLTLINEIGASAGSRVIELNQLDRSPSNSQGRTVEKLSRRAPARQTRSSNSEKAAKVAKHCVKIGIWAGVSFALLRGADNVCTIISR